MVKNYVLDQLLAEWFFKSLLAPIIEDVAKGEVVIKEKAITCAQYLDLVYTQSGSLYDKIQNALILSNIIPPPLGKESHAADGIIGSASSQLVSRPSGISFTAPT